MSSRFWVSSSNSKSDTRLVSPCPPTPPTQIQAQSASLSVVYESSWNLFLHRHKYMNSLLSQQGHNHINNSFELSCSSLEYFKENIPTNFGFCNFGIRLSLLQYNVLDAEKAYFYPHIFLVLRVFSLNEIFWATIFHVNIPNINWFSKYLRRRAILWILMSFKIIMRQDVYSSQK